MESITMTIDLTIDAKHMSRVRPVCPEAGLVLLAANRGWVQGTAVPAAIVNDARVLTDAPAPTSYVGRFGADATQTLDVAFHPFGEPPV
jgi:hypothetical protein